MSRFVATLGLFWLLVAASATHAAENQAQLEFFEKQIRPLLVERCYECHGPKMAEPKGGFRFGNHKALLAGGDTGAAVVPGKPAESLLIDAVNYGDIYQMPPKSKLSQAEIAALTKWVQDGAIWPGDEIVVQTKNEFDLAARKAEHWAWSPVQGPVLPAVQAQAWPQQPLDRFILARLEQQGLAPAEPADCRTLIRRAYFDLIGLPPSPAEVEAFVNDASPDAFAKVVDQLLASPHFGERWARHWLDLVRYAESRGHEFDYDVPNAWQYRDYVIRAFNADVPYNQFVTEHIAGDLLEQPRLHPEHGYNESILGTGFWFLGEWVHSPVDIRQDECDRFDNMLDVMGKTFLGLTIGCARCHDHKFDAISQRDYYALQGFLQSSSYRQVRFETLEHNRGIAQALQKLRNEASPRLRQALYKAFKPSLDRTSDYLLAAREALRFAQPNTLQDIVFEDFETGYTTWEITGDAFGKAPPTGTLPRQQAVSGFAGQHLVNTYVGGDGSRGTATSTPFEIERQQISFLIGGGAHAGKTCLNLLVDGRVVRTATGKNNEKLEPVQWDVADLQGKTARLQIVDDHTSGWGHVNVDHIVFTSAGQKVLDPAQLAPLAERHNLDPATLAAWVMHLHEAAKNEHDPLHAFAQLAQRSPLTAKAEQDVVKNAVEKLQNGRAPQSDALAGAEVIVDYANVQPVDWLQDGFAFGPQPQRPGDLWLSNHPLRPIAGVASRPSARRDPVWQRLKLARGAQNDSGRLSKYDRAGQTLRTPTFELTKPNVYTLCRGPLLGLAVVDSHRMINGPLHGQVIREWNDETDRPQWRAAHNLSAYLGHRIHMEYSPLDDGEVEVLLVVQADATPGEVLPALNQQLASGLKDADSLAALAEKYEALFRNVAQKLSAGDFSGEERHNDQAELADWLVSHTALFLPENAPAAKELAAVSREIIAEREQLVSAIRRESLLAPAMLDGSSDNERLLIRGNPKTPGAEVPRRFLTSIAGSDQPVIEHRSGRLELARQMTDPANPFASRVIVNRLWQHLFGRGIVGSVDNFGVLGQRPTHPELLDHLAVEFVEDGWSLKRAIRRLLLSATYQMSSRGDGRGDAVDPDNKLLHRMRVRRLEAEAIRDSLLAVSGRLDDTMFGQSVNVYLTPFMQGRGRPAGGPLDGAGRRSIYIAIRRNFLSPMMLAFDAPIPFNSMGRRNSSNVPAQALILMNDPFVLQQAQAWARQVLASDAAAAEERIERMYLTAFARPPAEHERAAALEFLHTQALEYGLADDAWQQDERVWADLAHVLINVKEFIFIP